MFPTLSTSDTFDSDSPNKYIFVMHEHLEIGLKKSFNSQSLAYLPHAAYLIFEMAEVRRSTRESVQVYANARNTISQNGVVKDLISSFLSEYEVNGKS